MPYSPASYMPTWVEWSVFAGAVAGFSLVIAIFVRLFPVVSMWEVAEQYETKGERVAALGPALPAVSGGAGPIPGAGEPAGRAS